MFVFLSLLILPKILHSRLDSSLFAAKRKISLQTYKLIKVCNVKMTWRSRNVSLCRRCMFGNSLWGRNKDFRKQIKKLRYFFNLFYVIPMSKEGNLLCKHRKTKTLDSNQRKQKHIMKTEAEAPFTHAGDSFKTWGNPEFIQTFSTRRQSEMKVSGKCTVNKKAGRKTLTSPHFVL